METIERIRAKKDFLAVVGLGYVGLPLAVAFAEKVKTLGFDINQEKISIYQKGIDPTNEIGDEKIQNSTLEFTTDPTRLKEAKFIIVAVPTPVNGDKTPNLVPIINASKIIGRNLSQGSIIVFESTVYPGVTEDVCGPILEKESGLVCGKDFKIGYSPERINPGDRVHTLENIQKIVAGMDEETVENIAAVYELIIHAGVYRAPSIKVAEAAKLAENAQRDINIAFMNELAMAFDRMGISTKEVIDAMNTKWNALGFYPGLVGGHCIGVDPYYFIYQAKMLGYYSQIIAAGRKVNDNMAIFVTDNIIKKMIQSNINVKKSNIYIMGITFKENCPDMRNSKAVDVCKHLATYGIKVKVVDPIADKAEFKKEFDMDLVDLKDVRNADCLVFLVAHQQFKDLRTTDFRKFFKSQKLQTKDVFIDIKSIFEQKAIEEEGYSYWSL
ncbi:MULTISPECIES: nucleotide sugar dehydrogenase [Pelosinus]|jgi:UDP-N-acetyl-D-galactosamine dehydrogenase|uniref:Nucleotide sugar dehydrogenase n=1 Tax=Pelosinus fermentans B4 TaxID=1149862 RepID=I9B5P2_9FIRM|nr:MULTISPECIES: nucleotide sugar dehydrogenase [Pelosinus]EIW20442.1 nucleotide sugar dehydrogenase [Pelosinus fermentans B4]EIW25843.1 nucleotide sugar dehydrogenase [Pelosinus fermentans A11]OAM93567.1 nucleotide sugar dehydrogenase [Pelosinus fermentans DSM 17108]SDQ82319.1 UDP-N-acetyl-D-galactosamine dehydrogenase [Pelosinus fermentans]